MLEVGVDGLLGLPYLLLQLPCELSYFLLAVSEGLAASNLLDLLNLGEDVFQGDESMSLVLFSQAARAHEPVSRTEDIHA